MKLNQEPGPEMLAFMKAVREAIDSTVEMSMENLKNGADQDTPKSEREAYQTLHDALTSPQQIQAFEGIIKNICLSVLHSVLSSVDEGIEGPGGRQLKLDIVDKQDKESIITWSAQEEFWYAMPDDYVPFDYE